MKVRQVDFSDGRIGSNIFHSSIPMLIAQMLSLLYSVVDRIFIGRVPGDAKSALAGIGLCFPIIIIVTAFTNLFGLGGAPLCSISRGKGDREQAQRIMNTAFFMLVVCSCFIMILGELFAGPMLCLFGASDGTIRFALPYMRIYLLGTLFSMVSTGLNPYINSQGYARTGMFTVVIGSISNLILDPVFIFIFGMGVKGAALATIISQLFSAIFVIRFLTNGKTELGLHLMSFAEFRNNLPLAKEISALGLSSFVMQFTNSLVTIVCNHMLSGLGGDLFVTVMTVISSVRQILDTPVISLGEGTTPVLSYNYGANRPALVRKTIAIMCVCMLAYTFVVWRLIELMPALFIGIFNKSQDTIEAGLPALHIYFLTFIFQGLQICGQTTFKALNMKKRAIFFSLFRKVILVVPLTILLPTFFGLGTNGVFMAEPISNFVGGSACFITMLLTVLPQLGKMGKSENKN